MSIHDLPAVNASLNALSGVLLLIAYVHIRARRIEQHRRFMLAAFTTSSLFLVSYLVYHAQVGSVPFTRQGFVRPLYFGILITHVTLAATVVPLALVTLSRGLKARYLVDTVDDAGAGNPANPRKPPGAMVKQGVDQ